MGVFAVVVFVGAPMVISGDLTTGALVAASILSSRMLGPMGQITQVLTRWQHAKVAIEAAESLMQDRKSTRLKLQSRPHLVCRLLLEKKKKTIKGKVKKEINKVTLSNIARQP